MTANPFELILLIPAKYRELPETRELKSATRLSWAGPCGEIGVIISDFPSTPTKSLEDIEQLAARPGVFMKVGERLIENRAKFVRVLRCYLDSLKENDPSVYCTGKAAEVGWHIGCPNPPCFSTCQFVCTDCLQRKGAVMSPTQLYDVAVRAELAWCPNFRSPNRG
jgi:hypothetical protein